MTTVLSEAQRSEVHQLLCSFSDVFSAGPDDLGCTDLVKHHIDTGQAEPIRQPPRWLPLTNRQRADKGVQEMQERDVIEPSASPWSSPIVLVRKKMGVRGSVSTTVSSTKSHTRIHTHCRVLATHLKPYVVRNTSLHWIFEVAIGRSNWMTVPKGKRSFPLEMDYGSSKSHHLIFVMPLLHLNA